MQTCKECGWITPYQGYLCKHCLETLTSSKIQTLKPSKLENTECADIFPAFLVDNMTSSLRKDINETLQCVYYELWTATTLMSTRLLESELKTHIEEDLHYDGDLRSIGDCLKVLQNHDYPAPFLQRLDLLKDLRNEGMHGIRRFSPKESLTTFRDVFTIIAWIYNIIV